MFNKATFDSVKTRGAVDGECDFCGGSFFKRKDIIQQNIKNGKDKFYCSISCSKRAVSVPDYKLNCENCKKIINVSSRRFDASESKHFYCDVQCCSEFKSKNTKRNFVITCCFCFHERKTSLREYNISLDYERNFCNEECRKSFRLENPFLWAKKHKEHLLQNCLQCKKEFVNKNKYKVKFCSLSCSSIHSNIHSPRKPSGSQTSYPEIFIRELIKQEYPNLDIISNDRKILNGLEIDIFIPSINLAIEVNGPSHYKPIFGQQAFAKRLNNDNKKYQILWEKDIVLLGIDVSNIRKNKKDAELTALFYKDIVPTIRYQNYLSEWDRVI